VGRGALRRTPMTVLVIYISHISAMVDMLSVTRDMFGGLNSKIWNACWAGVVDLS
jgi:hypothetical protein